MRQALFTLRIAGAWSYRVILTDEIETLGMIDTRAGEILLADQQSAQTAAAIGETMSSNSD